MIICYCYLPWPWSISRRTTGTFIIQQSQYNSNVQTIKNPIFITMLWLIYYVYFPLLSSISIFPGGLGWICACTWHNIRWPWTGSDRLRGPEVALGMTGSGPWVTGSGLRWGDPWPIKGTLGPIDAGRVMKVRKDETTSIDMLIRCPY